jgi:HSP20 family protein
MSEHRLIPSSWVRHPGEDLAAPHPLHDLRTKAEHLLDVMYDKIGRHHHAISGHLEGIAAPRADVTTDDVAFKVEMELPGVDEGDVEVLVSADELTVRGEKRTEREVAERHYHLRERAYGAFRRSFRLPPEADAGRAKASYKHGVLTVSVPAKAGARRAARKIPVTAR